MIFALALLVGLQIPNPFAHHGPIRTEHRMVGGWRVTAASNSFTRATTCTIAARDMEVTGEAVVFRFPRGVDTTNAWYRIDSGEAQAWRALAPELLTLGVALRFHDIDNPSLGRVPIPLRLVRTAEVVAIAPEPKVPARTFKLRGLVAAMAEAQALGCPRNGLSGGGT